MSTIRVRVSSRANASQELQKALAGIDGNVAPFTAKVSPVSGVSWNEGDSTPFTERLTERLAELQSVTREIDATLTERLKR